MYPRIVSAFAIVLMTVVFASGEGLAQESCQSLANDARAECYADETEHHASVAEAAAERAIVAAAEGDIEAAKAAEHESAMALNSAAMASMSAVSSDSLSAAAKRAKLEYERADNAVERAIDAVAEIDTERADTERAERLALIERAFGEGGVFAAGPFGYNAGDEMPAPMEPTTEMDMFTGGVYAGINPAGLSLVIVSPPEGWHTLAVMGTRETGVCGIALGRIIQGSSPVAETHVQRLEDRLSEKYGHYDQKEDNITAWLVYGASIFAIALTTTSNPASNATLLEVTYEFSNIGECLEKANSGL